MQITIRDDFSLNKIVDSGQCFRAQADSQNRFTFITREHMLQICPLEGQLYEISCSIGEWDEIWVPYFDLSRNYSEIRQRIRRHDPFMRRTADYGEGIRILRQDPFETLISFIISQRKSIPAIRGAVQKLCVQYGQKREGPLGHFFTFPDADTLFHAGKEGLDQCGLGYRSSYVIDASKRILEKDLLLETLQPLPPEEISQALMSIRGVGQKVSDCVCLFAYGKTSLAPVDAWIARVIDRIYHGDNPFRNCGDDAGIMQQYAFYYCIRHKNEFSSY